MNLDDLTIGQLKEIQSLLGSKDCANPFEIGKCYLIRTVTMIQVGRLVKVYPQELVLADCSWVADTGRFANALKTGDFSEVEPFPDGEVIVGRGSIIDACTVAFDPPRKQK